MRNLFLLVVVVAALFPLDSFACRPDMAFVNLPFVEKVEEASPLFVGQVAEVGGDYLDFRIISTRRGTPPAGQSVRVPHESAGYGKCGKLEFTAGDIWLFAENDLPFGATTKLTEADLGSDGGADIEAVIQRVGQRISPGH